MAFQPPSFVQPRQYNIPGSIDELFNAYQQQKQFENQQSEMNARRVSGLMQYGIDPYSVTPDQIKSAQQPAPTTLPPGMMPNQQPQDYSSRGASQIDYSQPGLGTPQLAQEDNVTTHLRNLISLGQQSAALGAQEKRAGIAGKQAEAYKNITEGAGSALKANLLGGAVPSYQDFVSGRPQAVQPQSGPNVITGTVDQVQAGRLAPDEMFDAAGREPMVRLAMQNEANKRGLNQLGLQNQAEGLKKRAAGIGEVQGGQGQNLGSAVGTLEDILNRAEPMIKGLAPTQIKLLNKAWSQGLSNVNDEQANEVLALMNEARGKYATILAQGKAAQAEDKAAAAESIGRGLNEHGFSGMKKAALFAGKSTMSRIQGNAYNEPAAPTAQEIVTKGLAAGKARAQIKADLKAAGF